MNDLSEQMRLTAMAAFDGVTNKYKAGMTTLRLVGVSPLWDESGELDGWVRGNESDTWDGRRQHFLEHTDCSIISVHDDSSCAGRPCTIHNRSDHSMRGFKQHWRSDRGIMERICPHGVGHPDPDSPWALDDLMWIHACDGCCG